MRFASCRRGDELFAAVIDGTNALPLEGVKELGAGTSLELLASPPVADAAAVALDELQLRPVVPTPGKIICLGLNYQAHVAETARELPDYPVLFTKFASSLVGHAQPIIAPPESDQMDYEAEMAVVVGRRIRRASGRDALDAVAGYTIANDITMRDFQYKTHQWLQGKAWESSTPLGPFLVTPDEVGDPGKLRISLQLNGETMQDSTTERLIFDIPTILQHLSTFVTLEPGDVILTGTPGGVGFRRDPKVALQPGDRLRVEIDRLGVLENEVVAEAATDRRER